MCPKDVPRLQKPGFELIFSTVSAVYIAFHKVTKIVCILSLAERLIHMRVCKHGCEVKMFCCARGNHTSRNLKKRFVLNNWTSLLYLPIFLLAET